MKKFLLNLSFFFAVCLALLITYGLVCEWFFSLDKYLTNDSKRTWSMKQSYQHFDYVVLGSSRAEGAFDMNMLDSLTGLKGINIGANGSGFVDNYLVLYKFIQNKNTFNYIFLQTDIYSLDPSRSFSNAFHVFNFIPYWKSPEFKTAISHYLDNTDQVLFSWVPWLRFYKYNKYYSPIQMIARIKGRKEKNKRIDHYIKSTAMFPKNLIIDSTIFFKPKGSRKIIVDSFDVVYLEKILNLSKSNGISVVCFTAPDFYYQDQIYSNYHKVNASLVSFLQERDVKYLAANDSLKMHVENFKDPGHLSDYGRFLNTVSFSKSINAIKNKTTLLP